MAHGGGKRPQSSGSLHVLPQMLHQSHLDRVRAADSWGPILDQQNRKLPRRPQICLNWFPW